MILMRIRPVYGRSIPFDNSVDHA